MAEPRWTWHREFVIPSRAGAGKQVKDEVLDQLHDLEWGKHDIFSVHLALEEALANAIKHGNRFDEAKQVRIAAQIAPELLRIQVADEGEGFDPSTIPDPTDTNHLETPCGRGIMLMRSFMTSVEYDQHGTCVTLEKRPSKQKQANS